MNKQVLALIFYFGISLIGELVLFMLNNPKSLVILINFIYPPICLIVIYLLLKDELYTTVFEKEKTTIIKSIKTIVLWFFIMVTGFIVITTVKSMFFPTELSNSMKITKAYPLIIISFVFIGPILEEIIFRRIIFTFFTKKSSVTLSIILTSMIFAGWHMTVSGFPLIFWLSTVYAYTYFKTNRLVVPIILHILWNLFASSLTLLFN